MGELAKRQPDAHLVDGHLEAVGQLRQVRRDDCCTVVEQRESHVAACEHLTGELTDDLAQLHGEERAADVAQETAGTGDHL